MSTPQPGNVVKIHYTGRLADGAVFDSSEGRAPLEFTIGSHQVIPGFEEAVLTLEPGQTATVTIPADKAYGARREEMVATVSRDQFPQDIAPEVGVQLQVPQPDGRFVVVEITSIDGDQITLDANHRLAGKDLTFDITLVEIA